MLREKKNQKKQKKPIFNKKTFTEDGNSDEEDEANVIGSDGKLETSPGRGLASSKKVISIDDNEGSAGKTNE